jgi:hypothetical protein
MYQSHRGAAFHFETQLQDIVSRSIRPMLVYPAYWPDHLLWGPILAYLLTSGGGSSSPPAACEH